MRLEKTIKKRGVRRYLEQNQLYEPEKDGPMVGSSIPPAPVYSSRFLMVDEDISFDTSVHWHSGHCGAGSLVDTRSTSKL